jgi:internalin A
MIRKILLEVKDALEKQYKGYTQSFNPPATDDEILAYEQLIGKSLPDGYKDLYLSHNGQQRFDKYGLAFFFSLPFLSIRESMEQWKSLNQQLDDMSQADIKSHSIPVDCIREQYLNPAWIPISKDSGGNFIGIDLDPYIKGTYGQVINFGRDEDNKYVIASGIGELLAYMFDLIRKNRLSILEQEDDDADEEEDDDGNPLPLPKVYRFAIDGKIIWHFLDWLKVLNLPGKPVLSEWEKNYNQWLDDAPQEWKALTNANCNSDFGFIPPAEIVRFYPRALPVPDLMYIHHFSNLREVILSGTLLTDISALESLPYLKTLFLSSSKVTRLGVLQNLKRLRELHLNNLEIEDFTLLQELPLIDLTLEKSSIKDLTPISKIKTLRTLDISDTLVDTGELLTSLKHLRSLDISKTRITDLSFLNQLDALQEISIYGLTPFSYEPLFQRKTITRVTGSFAVLKNLRENWTHKVSYVVQGEMTSEEKEEWREFHR